MFLHSIRWRLQLWHGLLLVVVLAGFGVTAFQLQRANTYRRVDQELQRGVNVVGTVLRRPRPGPPPRGEFPPEPPGPEDDLDFPPRRGPEGPPRFQMPPNQERFFDTNSGLYYVVWRRDGDVIGRSETAPADVPRPERSGDGHVTRMRGPRREVFHFTPPGECLLVGRDVAAELADLRQLAWLLSAAGAGVLIAGLAGGWWLSSRAIRPIADISSAAARISTGDLSQRIQTSDADSELGQLAAVLNSTFERLQAAFEQQVRFTADAAHELRTPVAVMLGQTQTALTRERPASEYRSALEACQRAAQRMRSLIESLLALARLDANEEPLKRTAFDLSRVVRENIELVTPIAREREVTIVSDLPPAQCTGDPERIAQVVTNLLTNAIYYNRKPGEVRVSIGTNDGAAVLSVTDTGSGIAPEHLSHIFERFYRVDASRSQHGRTGLGLAICKAIVDAHGGTIEVTSTVDKGATFRVRLPS